jgi:hypothetical protein
MFEDLLMTEGMRWLLSADHPFGPYADDSPEKTHKYGPFGQIKTAKKR